MRRGYGWATAAAVAIAGVLLFAGSHRVAATDPTFTPSCLEAGWKVQNETDGTFTTGLDETPSEVPILYDARNVRVEIEMLDASVKNGFVVRSNLRDVCIVGIEVVGTQSTGLDWSLVGHGGDGVGWRVGSVTSIGRMIVEGAYFDNIGGDAIDPAKDFSAMGDGYSWYLRHSYVRGNRDDVIENDACHPGEIDDVLVDDSFIFLSTRPGAGNFGSTGTTAPVIHVKNSLVDINSGLFKWANGNNSDCTPRAEVNMSNTILRVQSGATTAQLDFPDGTYSNVTVIWLGGGSYPGTLPASGVTVITNDTVWDDARADWLRRHGCDSAGDACNNLLLAKAPKPHCTGFGQRGATCSK
jgi:hypothetical protein